MNRITSLIDQLIKDNITLALIKAEVLKPGEFQFNMPVPTPTLETVKQHREEVRYNIDMYFDEVVMKQYEED